MNLPRPLLVAVLTLLALAGMTLSHVKLDDLKTRKDGVTDAVYLPDPAFAKAMALGFPEVFGNLYLLRAQVYWVDHRFEFQPEIIQTLRALTDLATELNPGDRYGYLFGANAFGDFGGLGHSYAIDLLKKGWVFNPNSPDYPKNIGFEYYLYSETPVLAVPWFRSTAMMSGEDINTAWMKDAMVWMVEKLLANDGDSCELTLAVLKDSLQYVKEDKQKDGLTKQIQVQELLCQLENVAKRFKQEQGRWPDTLDELLAQTNLKSVKNLPPDPFEGEYVLLADGRVDTTSRLQRHGRKQASTNVFEEAKKAQEEDRENQERQSESGVPLPPEETPPDTPPVPTNPDNPQPNPEQP